MNSSMKLIYNFAKDIKLSLNFFFNKISYRQKFRLSKLNYQKKFFFNKKVIDIQKKILLNNFCQNMYKQNQVEFCLRKLILPINFLKLFMLSIKIKLTVNFP